MMIYSIYVFLVLTSHVYSQTKVKNDCTVEKSGQRGICKPFSECPEVIQKLKEGVRPSTCGFGDIETIICCPIEESFSLENKISSRLSSVDDETDFINFESNEKRISERKCEEYSSKVVNVVRAIRLLLNSEPITFNVANCKYDNIPLIVGGEEVKVGEFPHMAAIGWPTINENEYAWNCGGSLISENFVLTAAHCTSDKRNNLLTNPFPTLVRLGEHNLKSDNDGAEPQDIKISVIIMHPEYNFSSKYHDIALFRLESPARFTKFVRPACLGRKLTFPQQPVIATGWGKLQFAQEQSDVLRSVSIKIIDQNKCASLYSVITKNLPRGIIEEQLCAGDLNGGKDTCQGDSGGPLQISELNNQCIFYVVGITSFGAGCGGRNSPGVYTRVSSYIDWIEHTVWPKEF